MLYFWWHGFEWLRYVMLLLMTTWLWQFTLIKSTKTFTAQYLGISGLFVAIAVGIILVLMCLSFIHVLLTDHVIGFRTNVIVSWLKPLSALVFLTSYLSLSRQQNKPS
jgi:branched-subunit amino acid transport protein AzlD